MATVRVRVMRHDGKQRYRIFVLNVDDGVRCSWTESAGRLDPMQTVPKHIAQFGLAECIKVYMTTGGSERPWVFDRPKDEARAALADWRRRAKNSKLLEEVEVRL